MAHDRLPVTVYPAFDPSAPLHFVINAASRSVCSLPRARQLDPSLRHHSFVIFGIKTSLTRTAISSRSCGKKTMQ